MTYKTQDSTSNEYITYNYEGQPICVTLLIDNKNPVSSSRANSITEMPIAYNYDNECWEAQGYSVFLPDINAEVISLPVVKPLDAETVINSAKKTNFVVTIEDGTIIGGLGSSIKEIITEKNIKDAKIKCFAYPDEFIQHGSPKELEEL